MRAPLIIVGPTSSGKTSLSFFLATQFPDVQILVVDSKQVYTEQDIVTGKDLPDSIPVPLLGIDVVKPDEEWSVAQFLEYAKECIEKSRRENKQLLIVGGTPQYLLSLFGEPETSAVLPNEKLRTELEKYSVEELQNRLGKSRLSKMNDSDSKNPRRLIRAIEIQEAAPEENYSIQPGVLRKQDCQWIGLSVEKDDLEKRIRSRVIDRLSHGAMAEYETLRQKYPNWSAEAKSAIGYQEIEDFLQGKIPSKEELIDIWTLHETQYAKRQMTWWKREEQIHWFSAVSPDLQTQVLDFLKSCYNE